MKTKLLFLLFLFLSVSLFFFPPSGSIHSSTTENQVVSIGLLGDLGLGRMITATARSKNDFSYSFAAVSPWLQKNDFNLTNLESPIIKNCPTGPLTTMVFCGDPRFLPQLQQHKFILNLANNHIKNYGQHGLDQTYSYLDQSQIRYFYSHQNTNLVTSLNGISFAFLGFDLTGAHSYNQDQILALVDQYNPQVDWLIVSLHWGNEYLPRPKQWRVDLAHQLIDRGADLIHGHHPHVWQDEEIYQGKYIFYSLGNFIFDQNWSVPTSTSNLVTLTLTKDQVLSIQKTPFTIKHNVRPEIDD